MIPEKSEKFLKCIPIILSLEGYHSKDPADSGGETFWGLCEKYEPAEVEAMRHMTEQESREYASNWYYEHYWLTWGLEKYDTKLALTIFNLAEACGPSITKIWLDKLGDAVTWEKLLLEAMEYRAGRVNKDPTQKVFLLGWINGLVILKNFRL